MVLGFYSGSSGTSWIAFIFIAGIVLRVMMGSRRRRPMRVSAPPPVPATMAEPPGTAGDHKIAAGWMVDPSGRFEQRYWSGTEWTEHVMRDGVPSVDPPPGAPRGNEATPDPGAIPAPPEDHRPIEPE